MQVDYNIRSVSLGVSVIWFYVLLNKVADRTPLHSSLRYMFGYSMFKNASKIISMLPALYNGCAN